MGNYESGLSVSATEKGKEFQQEKHVVLLNTTYKRCIYVLFECLYFKLIAEI